MAATGFSRFPWRRAVLVALASLRILARAEPVDVVIYGATPGGNAAALAAAKGGHTVLLAEPTIRIGGMTGFDVVCSARTPPTSRGRRAKKLTSPRR